MNAVAPGLMFLTLAASVTVRREDTVHAEVEVLGTVRSHAAAKGFDVAVVSEPVTEHTQLSVGRNKDRSTYWATTTDEGGMTSGDLALVATARGYGFGGYTSFCLVAARDLSSQDKATAIVEAAKLPCDWDLVSSKGGTRWELAPAGNADPGDAADANSTAGNRASVEYKATRWSTAGALDRDFSLRLDGNHAFRDVKPFGYGFVPRKTFNELGYVEQKFYGQSKDKVTRVAEASVSNVVMTADPEARQEGDSREPPLPGDLLQLGKAGKDLYRLDLFGPKPLRNMAVLKSVRSGPGNFKNFNWGGPGMEDLADPRDIRPVAVLVPPSRVQAFAFALSSMSWKLRVN